MSQAGWIRRIAQRVVRVGVLPGDSDEEQAAKVRLTVLVVLLILAGVVWGLAYLHLGLVWAAGMALGYSAGSLISLLHFSLRKRFVPFAYSQFLGVLVLPCALQWLLGGFVHGSAMMLFAVLSPTGVLTFLGPRPAMAWFGAFVAMGILSGGIELVLPVPAVVMPGGVRTLFFVLNVLMVSVCLFVAFQHFARMQIAAHSALQQEHALVRAEKARSERLLLNILPAAIAARLKNDEMLIADGFPEASILFADIVGFTRLSERISPTQLVSLLNEVFSQFDQLAERHGLEKIKTIGDAYMVAGGIPEPCADHPQRIAEMALDMQRAVGEISVRWSEPLSVRIGINIGPVVAGIIGKRKFIYDLWGDAVNTASRMESQGLPSCIQVTQQVADRLQGRYRFQDRGPIDIKGKGEMRTYLLIGRSDKGVLHGTA